MPTGGRTLRTSACHVGANNPEFWPSPLFRPKATAVVPRAGTRAASGDKVSVCTAKAACLSRLCVESVSR
jgi:hypothetical protein